MQAALFLLIAVYFYRLFYRLQCLGWYKLFVMNTGFVLCCIRNIKLQ